MSNPLLSLLLLVCMCALAVPDAAASQKKTTRHAMTKATGKAKPAQKARTTPASGTASRSGAVSKAKPALKAAKIRMNAIVLGAHGAPYLYS